MTAWQLSSATIQYMWNGVWAYVVDIDSQTVSGALPHAVLPGAKAFAGRLGAQVEDGCSLQ